MAEIAQRTAGEGPIRRYEPVAGPAHTLVLLLILAAVAVIGYFSTHRSGFAQRANHFVFYLTTMAWEWLVFAYILWGLRRRGKSFRDIAGGRWKSGADFLRDLGIAFVFWIGAILVLSVTASLVHARGFAQTARLLAPHGPAESLLWVCVSLTAGICEETIFRGYLQRQFVAWTRSAPLGVLVSAALFGAGHIYQGARTTIVIGVFGLLFGILAEVRQSLRPGMMTHAWQDTLSGLLVRFLPQ